MSLTPNEILHKEFDRKFRGYHEDQVNDYLDVIVVEFEKLISQNNDLLDKVDALTERLNYFEQLQESLNTSILIAQEAAERLKQNARKEAELIIYEAEGEADNIVNQASGQANKIMTESEAMRRQSQSFRQDLRLLIEAQLNLIDNEKYDVLFAEFDQFQRETAEIRHTSFDASKVDEIVSSEEEAFSAADRLAENHQAFNNGEVVTFDEELLGHEASEFSLKEDLEATQILKQEDLNELAEAKEDFEENNDFEATAAEPEIGGQDDYMDPSTSSVFGKTIRIELPNDNDFDK